jgi:hypothetical protein
MTTDKLIEYGMQILKEIEEDRLKEEEDVRAFVKGYAAFLVEEKLNSVK